MEKFLELLEDYGLEFGFVYKNKTKFLQMDMKHILEAKEKENAFEGLLYMMEELVIRIVDYKKLSEKLKMPKKFDVVGVLIEGAVGIELEKTNGGGVKSYFYRIKDDDFKLEKIMDKVESDLPRCGISKSRLELKEMFGEKGALLDEIQPLIKVLDNFTEWDEFEEELEPFVQNVKKTLNNKKDEPNWYLEYAKKNKKFKKMFDELTA